MTLELARRHLMGPPDSPAAPPPVKPVPRPVAMVGRWLLRSLWAIGAACALCILAAWGVDDQRVLITHGRHFRDAAGAAKVELEYVEYPEEGHVWMKRSTRIDFFARAEKLLARTLGSR